MQVYVTKIFFRKLPYEVTVKLTTETTDYTDFIWLVEFLEFTQLTQETRETQRTQGCLFKIRRGARVVDRDGLENRFPLNSGTWVRIPPSPPVKMIKLRRYEVVKMRTS